MSSATHSSHAYGAAFDNPDLLVACVVGDGEAETGPLATSWHANKFLNPRTDGAVLPILHLNGYKIAGPTVLARIPEAELGELMRGYGYEPLFISIDAEDDHADAHERFAAVLDEALERIEEIQRSARVDGVTSRPTWPMIVLRVAEGLDGTARGGRAEDRRHLALASGTCRRRADERGASPCSGRVVAELSPGGALRRRRAAPSQSYASLHPKASCE